MDELRQRFARLEQLRAPDLWPEISDRASNPEQDARLGVVRVGLRRNPDPVRRGSSPVPRFVSASSGRLVAVAVIALLLAAAVVTAGARRTDDDARDPGPAVA